MPTNKYSKISELPYEEQVKLMREYVRENPKTFTKYIDRIAPDPYRGTRKLASMLIQQYPERFPGATADNVIDVMQKIAQVETGDRNIKQMKGGPGRGEFQMELSTAPTALKRYQNYQDILAPLSELSLPQINLAVKKPSLKSKKLPTADVTPLTKDERAMLALSNISGNAAKSQGIIDVTNPMDVWATYHWAGSPEQRPERERHWLDTFPENNKRKYGGWTYPTNTGFPEYAQGGKLTKKGKKIRKYGPRPDYMNQNPSGMTTGPITQRSIGNTPGGGYMAFGQGGWTGYPDHTMYSSAMGQFDKVRDYTKYKQGGVTWSIVKDRPMAEDGMLVKPGQVPQGFFLNPGAYRKTPADFHVYQEPKTYTPGQNAAKGTVEPDYTIEEMLMPLPKIGGVFKGAAKAAEAAKGAEAIGQASLKKAIAPKALKAIDALEGTLSVGEELTGRLFKNAENKAAIKEGNTWLKDWINNPTTRNKITADLETQLKKVNQYAGENMAKNNTDFYNLMKDQAIFHVPNVEEHSIKNQILDNLSQYRNIFNPKVTPRTPIHVGNWGVSYKHIYDPDYIQYINSGISIPSKRYGDWVSRSPKINATRRASVVVHEGTHGWTTNELLNASGQKDYILDQLNPEIRKTHEIWRDATASGKDPSKVLGAQKAYEGYLANPTEIQARIMEARKYFKLKPEHHITEDWAKQAINHIEVTPQKDLPFNKEFIDVLDKDPKKLANLFNRLWAAPPAAAGIGYAASQNQELKMQAKGGQVTWQIID